VQIILFTGSQFRVRPGDLVGALANELNISGDRIGRVAIRERKSFVGLPRAIAEKALAKHDTLPVRGRPVRIAMAMSSPHQGSPSRGDRPFKGKPKRNKHKGKPKYRGPARGREAAA